MCTQPRTLSETTRWTTSWCLRLWVPLWVLLVRSYDYVRVVASGVLAAVPPLGDLLRALGYLCVSHLL